MKFILKQICAIDNINEESHQTRKNHIINSFNYRVVIFQVNYMSCNNTEETQQQ